jgi:hypothetical protein
MAVREAALRAAEHEAARQAAAREAAQRTANWLTCQDNLRRLHSAFNAFVQASNRPPDSVDELVPAFVAADPVWLRCPLERQGGEIAYSLRPSRSKYSSYLYEFGPEPASSSRARDDAVQLWKRGMTVRELRQAEMEHYGLLVPRFRCAHHFPVLNVSSDGEIFESFALWNPEVNAQTNPDGHLPPAWATQGALPGAFDASVDTNEMHSGQASAQIISRNPSNQVLLFQNIRADDFRGRSLTLSAWVKSEELKGLAGIRVQTRDATNNSLPDLRLDRARRVSGTTSWQRLEVTGVVPTNAAVLMLLVDLQGEGRVWADDFSLSVDGQPVTARSGGNTNFYTRAPANLDFEVSPQRHVRAAKR